MEPETISQPPHKQVDDETVIQEFGELVSSLPKVSVQESYIYQYQGFWFPPKSLQGVVNCQKYFQPRENDIFLVTAPKSGTTWLKAILYALINREAHPPKDTNHPLLNKAPHELVPLLEHLDPSEYNSICNSSDRSTRIFASHIPVSSLPKSVTDNNAASLNCKIVYLCRDIKDNFVSSFHFINNNKYLPSPISLADAFDMYCKGNFFIGPVWDQILGYWKESLEKPHKVLFMKYEEMQNEPQFQLRRLAQFLGKPFSLEEENSGFVDQIVSLCSFDTMSKLQVNNTQETVRGFSNKSYFRNGVVGDAKNYLSADMVSRLNQITEEKFRGSGLSL